MEFDLELYNIINRVHLHMSKCLFTCDEYEQSINYFKKSRQIDEVH